MFTMIPFLSHMIHRHQKVDGECVSEKEREEEIHGMTP